MSHHRPDLKLAACALEPHLLHCAGSLTRHSGEHETLVDNLHTAYSSNEVEAASQGLRSLQLRFRVKHRRSTLLGIQYPLD